MLIEDFFSIIDVIELSHMCNCSKVVVEIQKFWETNFDGIIPKT